MPGLCEGCNEPPGAVKTISDVERSFSAYKVILSDTLRSLPFETLKMNVVVYCSRNRNQANNMQENLSVGLKNQTGKGKRLIVVHIGNENGFVDNALWVFESYSTKEYHEEMTGEAFHEWFGKILPKLEPGSVIVLDNAPYHTVKKEKLPTTAWRRDNILEWLKSKQIPLDSEGLLKKELLFLVSQHRTEKWADFVRHVIVTEEPRLWDMDNIVEEVEEMVINIGEDSTSESE
ncbi:hypothetical protein ANN_12870 [Periplaneta americana]|uniref:Tc1-like transposase DDE domain-containing protein n=1 Tax=Periplaneta americana TaxID=6978 RepID=A0ABQ8TKB5_PERAM|nr:hypothetical protein ANN_12870 [Periplaneta americana]